MHRLAVLGCLLIASLGLASGAAAGPSATQAINGPTTKRIGMRCTRSGTIPAAATRSRTVARLAGVA